MKKLFILTLVLVSMNVKAQDASMLRKDKMKSVALWEGTWRGEGWMMLADGQKHYFTQKEIVKSKFDGGVLMVEGFGKDKETGKAIHDALGFFTYDVIKQQYRFTAMTGSGYNTDVVPEVNADGFIWKLTNPRMGITKFTIKLSATEWIEIGEISRDDGKTWTSNFEMTLKRK